MWESVGGRERGNREESEAEEMKGNRKREEGRKQGLKESKESRETRIKRNGWKARKEKGKGV